MRFGAFGNIPMPKPVPPNGYKMDSILVETGLLWTNVTHHWHYAGNHSTTQLPWLVSSQSYHFQPIKLTPSLDAEVWITGQFSRARGLFDKQSFRLV